MISILLQLLSPLLVFSPFKALYLLERAATAMAGAGAEAPFQDQELKLPEHLSGVSLRLEVRHRTSMPPMLDLPLYLQRAVV